MAKRIILCFDGTWNEPETLKDNRVNPTNVLKFVRAISPCDKTNCEQVVYYETGVGTGGMGQLDKLIGGGTGLGISANIHAGYRFLANNYNKGDDIFVLGFSRGAYTARSLVGMISCVGLLKKADMEFVPQAYAYYRTEPDKRSASRHHTLITQLLESRQPDIKFMGVWDTVGALGAPTPLLGKISKKLWVGFHDTTLSALVEHACQALAIDERRGPFQPALWEQDNGRTQVQQVWFAGVHSNVGGGYPNSGLSDVAMEWMLKRACECGLTIDDEFCLKKLQPDPLGKAMDSYSLGYRMLEKLRVPPYIRPIGNSGLGEMIHESVIERLQDSRLRYRPANLIGESANLDGLLTETGDHTCLDVFGKALPVCRKREATRHPLEKMTGRLSIDGQPERICELIDFSPLGGVKITADAGLEPGINATLESDITGRQPVTMVWRNGECMGLKFAA